MQHKLHPQLWEIDSFFLHHLLLAPQYDPEDYSPSLHRFALLGFHNTHTHWASTCLSDISSKASDLIEIRGTEEKPRWAALNGETWVHQSIMHHQAVFSEILKTKNIALLHRTLLAPHLHGLISFLLLKRSTPLHNGLFKTFQHPFIKPGPIF